jgi:predicted Holliday junction resolvase-like endonuclease
MIEILLIAFVVIVAVFGHWVIVLKAQIKELKQKPESEPQGYFKFLEDSREAAFGYIEQAQLSILDFKNKTEAKNKTEIKESYNRLISLLPEEK